MGRDVTEDEAERVYKILKSVEEFDGRNWGRRALLSPLSFEQRTVERFFSSPEWQPIKECECVYLTASGKFLPLLVSESGEITWP